MTPVTLLSDTMHDSHSKTLVITVFQDYSARHLRCADVSKPPCARDHVVPTELGLTELKESGLSRFSVFGTLRMRRGTEAAASQRCASWVWHPPTNKPCICNAQTLITVFLDFKFFRTYTLWIWKSVKPLWAGMSQYGNWLRAGRRGSTPGRGRNFHLRHNTQTNCGARQTACPMNIDIFPGCKVATARS
jgi:hypothetical protein